MKKVLSILIIVTILMLSACASSDKGETSAAFPGASGSYVSSTNNNPNSVISIPEIVMESKSVTSTQVKTIKTGSTYQQIIDQLGKTANFGHMNLRQYIVDGDKILILHFNALTDVCSLSGDELLASAKAFQYPKGSIPKAPKEQTTVYGILVDKGFISCYDQYEGCYALVGNPVITDENGHTIAMSDIKLMSGLLVTFDYALETCPAQAHCLKIVVTNQ